MIRLIIFMAGYLWAKEENRKKTFEVSKKAGEKLVCLAKKGIAIIKAKI